MVSVANQEKKQERTTTEQQVSASGEFSICQHALAEFLGDATSALLLQRIHYWLQNEYSGYLLGDGIKRVYMGYKEIKEQFRWLSIYQIGRHIRRLEEAGWLKSDRFHNLNRNLGFITKAPHFQEDNQRKWYWLDYQMIFEDTEVDLLLGKEPHNSPKRPRRANVQNRRLQSAKLHIATCDFAQSSIQSNPNQHQNSLTQESEPKFFELPEDIKVLVEKELKEQEQVDLASSSEVKTEPGKSQEQQNPGEGQFSAVAPVKILEKPYSVKHARPNYYLNGFESKEEKDGFYQALLELGKQKAEVRSPVGWVCNIIKDINAGGTCEYLNEYRRGESLGACEQQEWENASGEVYPVFLTFLRRRLKTNQMSGEQAIAAVHKALRDTNQAKEHWESFKRTAVNLVDQWKRDKALGLSNAYVPPELLPDAQVAIEEAAQAMYALLEGSVQMQPAALPAAPQSAIEPAAAVAEPELSLEEKVTVWQKMWNAPNAELFGRKMVRKFVLETPGVILTDDGPVLETVVKPIPVEEETLKVGDRVIWENCPACCEDLSPFEIMSIDGQYAKLDLFEKPVLLKDLRRGG